MSFDTLPGRRAMPSTMAGTIPVRRTTSGLGAEMHPTCEALCGSADRPSALPCPLIPSP